MVPFILCFSTLALGAVHEPARYIVNLLILGSLGWEVVSSLSRGDGVQREGKPTSLPVIPFFLFAAFLLLIGFQYLLGTGIIQNHLPGTVNRHVTLAALVQLVYYLIFFVLVLRWVSQENAVEKTVSSLAVVAFLVTLWGITERLSGRVWFPWLGTSAGPRGFGPFVNPNHLGGFAGLCLPLFFGSLAGRFSKAQGRGAGWFLNSNAPFLILACILLVLGVIFAGARASGIILLIVSCGMVVAGAGSRGRRFLWVLPLFIFGTVYFFCRNYNLHPLWDAWFDRERVALESLGVFRAFPLFGSGLGTYFLLSSRFVTVAADNLLWDHVHNDYVELLLETGIVGFLLFLSSVASILFLSLRQRGAETFRRMSRLGLQAAISLFILSVMEYFDFHLRIPSLALLFTFQLALLFRWGRVPSGTVPTKTRTKYGLPKGLKICYALIGLGVGLSLAFYSTNEYRGHILSKAKKSRAENLKQAVEFVPDHALYWHELGLELGRHGVFALKRATELSPTFAPYWYSLGRLETLLGHEPEGIRAFEKAVEWAPRKALYALHLIDLYLVRCEAMAEKPEKSSCLTRAEERFRALNHLRRLAGEPGLEQSSGFYSSKRLKEHLSDWKEGG